MLADMRAGILKRNDLAGLLVWGLLSRGVGAYEQEGGFIVLHRAGLLDRVEQFFNGEISEEQMNDWSKEQMAGTPGASTSHNALKVGSMLNAMNSDIDGTKAIDLLYEAWKSDKTGPELRRRSRAYSPTTVPLFRFPTRSSRSSYWFPVVLTY